MSEKLNPYIRIMRAAKAGRGVRLSAREVHFLSFDSAIETAAANTSSGLPTVGGGFEVTRSGFADQSEDRP